MADRIGKYEIIERIGRGGMGTVYKARDSRLNRMVALKVVSPEVELTDELRTRFFDEAQACAGLSHPNIVTIYDVGEEDDRLYIVMELLDGQELKRLIADHVVLPLEEKVAVMIQLCDALAYAHDKGIIHRDIKPGNILFQRTGPAKIIDFGIAKMATSSSLTRTGLIMGTLRYMSPEQVRGRADTRSDQFSLAAVFYEMLSYRPPYIGEDPIQLLEQLRTESPPSLVDLDPTIPPELARVVERAMNKEPSERYPDLRSMRDDLEVVQRRIHEESQRLRKRFAALVTEVQEADAAASARIGGPVFEDAFSPSDTQPLIVSLKDKIAAAEQRLEALRDFTNKVDSLEGALQRGRELLSADHFAEACLTLQAVVNEIPQHVVAKSLLAQARSGEDLERRRHEARRLLDEATRALGSQDAGRCLALVQKVAELPAPPEAEEEIASLRRSAKTQQSEQDASRRARQQAERAREQLAEARRHAEAQDAAQYAPDAWSAAGAKGSEGEEHFRADRYSDALLSFDSAAETYASAEEEARERKLEQQRAAETARNAERLQLANRLLEEARGEFTDRNYVRCQEILRQVEEIPPPDEAREEFRRLGKETEAALQNERRSRKPAQQARMVMTAVRVDAQAEGAVTLASATWQAAEAKATAGSAAFVRELFAEARDVFESATADFRRALEEARAAKSAGQKAPDPEQAETPAVAPGAALLAEARAALEQGKPDVCLDILTRAAMSSPPPEIQQQISALLRTAADAARAGQDSSRDAGEEKRARAIRAAELLEEALRSAKRLGEPPVAPKIWAELEKKIASARVDFAREDYDAAFADYEAAIQLCQRFSDAARAAEKARTAEGTPAVVHMPTASRVAATDDETIFRRAPQERTGATGRVSRRARDESPDRRNMMLIALSGGALLAVLAAVLFPRSEEQSQSVTVAQPFDERAAAPIEGQSEEQARSAAQALTDTQAKAAVDERAAAEAKATTAAVTAFEEKAAEQARAIEQAKSAAAERAAAQARADADAQAQAEAAAKEKVAADAIAEAEARAAAKARLDAEAKEAVQARAAAQAAAEADAKAAAIARAEAEARAAAKERADADARALAAAEARAAAEKKAAADAKAKARREEEALARAEAARKANELQLARGPSADEVKEAEEPITPKGKGLLSTAFAAVYVEGTDGMKGGGAWGACWRNDLSSARACAKSSCEQTRNTSRPCQEIASTQPGGYCAVARATGFGVSSGFCADTASQAESGAVSSCLSQVRRTYGAVPATCKVVWSTNR